MITRREAENLGWNIVHEQDEVRRDLGDGNFKIVSGSYQAERPKRNGMIRQSSDTLEGLLRAIEQYENLANRRKPAPEPRVQEGVVSGVRA